MAGIPKANSFGVNRLLELFGIPIVDQKVSVAVCSLFEGWGVVLALFP